MNSDQLFSLPESLKRFSDFFPGDVPPWELFGAGDKGEEVERGNPSFTPPFIASAQAAEAVRILTRGDETQRKTLFWFDISRLTVRRLNLK